MKERATHRAPRTKAAVGAYPSGSRGWLAALLALGLGIGAASCGREAETGAAVAGEGALVRLQLFTFKPAIITVRAGTIVTWVQRDDTLHTVTSGTVAPIDPVTARASATPDGGFDSGTLDRGERFRFTFSTPGTYRYFCAIHPEGMSGEVRVIS